MQYFERVRLEFHPENADPRYQALLGQFGRRLHPADPPVAPQPGATFFPETGHNVPPDFLAFWRAHGGLPQFGFPFSEVFRETLEDGREYEVQYFERARFERHPENAPPNDVLLGQFGRRILAEGGPRTLTLAPASGPCPDARTSVVARGAPLRSLPHRSVNWCPRRQNGPGREY